MLELIGCLMIILNTKKMWICKGIMLTYYANSEVIAVYHKMEVSILPGNFKV